MCRKMMDTSSKHAKTDQLLKNVKRGSMRWRLVRMSTEEDEAFRQCRASAGRATLRKYLRRQLKRAQQFKVAQVLRVMGRRRPSAAWVHDHPPGAMAPENTTQYLMDNAYEDMEANAEAVALTHAAPARLYAEPLSPGSVYAALDSDYDSSLAFQQRDFEEVFDLCRDTE